MRGQVDPKLEAVDVSACAATGHFFVEDAATGAHPLHVAGTDRAFVAEAVAVGGGAFEHIGDGFDAAMRMIREAAQRAFEGIVEGEVVEEQEWVEQVADLWTERTEQAYARTLDGDLWFDELRDFSWVIHVV